MEAVVFCKCDIYTKLCHSLQRCILETFYARSTSQYNHCVCDGRAYALARYTVTNCSQYLVIASTTLLCQVVEILIKRLNVKSRYILQVFDSFL